MSEVAEWVKVFATKLGGLSVTPGTHMVEQNLSMQAVLWSHGQIHPKISCVLVRNSATDYTHRPRGTHKHLICKAFYLLL